MKTLVFSGYEPMNRDSLPPIFLRISEYQKRWADSIGADYIYNTTDLISRFKDQIENVVLRTRKINEEKGFSKNSRGGAVYADISRMMWIREHLKDYDEVLWVDGDFLPFKNFQIKREETAAPSMLREIMMSSFDPETGKENWSSQCRTVTCMRFTKDHIQYLDAHIPLAISASINSMIENKVWWFVGTELVSTLDRMFQYPTIDGVGFVTKKTLGIIHDSIENTQKYFEIHNRVWSKFDAELQGVNLSTNQDVDKLEMWIDLLDSNDYLLKV